MGPKTLIYIYVEREKMAIQRDKFMHQYKHFQLYIVISIQKHTLYYVSSGYRDLKTFSFVALQLKSSKTCLYSDYSTSFTIRYRQPVVLLGTSDQSETEATTYTTNKRYEYPVFRVIQTLVHSFPLAAAQRLKPQDYWV